MRFKSVGTKRDIMAVVIRNADTLTIKSGSPVFLAANGTNDGLAVVSANNLSAALQGNFFGIATADIAANAYGEAQVFGFFDQARVIVATRAASTDVWASMPAGSIGQYLLIGTGTGGVAASVSADQAFTGGATIAYSLQGAAQVRLMETYASQTTLASSLSGASVIGAASGTASYALKKVLVKAM